MAAVVECITAAWANCMSGKLVGTEFCCLAAFTTTKLKSTNIYSHDNMHDSRLPNSQVKIQHSCKDGLGSYFQVQFPPWPIHSGYNYSRSLKFACLSAGGLK